MSNFIYIVIFLFLIHDQAQSQVNLPNKLLTGQSIIIDGELNENAWLKSKISDSLYSKVGTSERNISSRTFFTYDSANAYIAFEMVGEINVKRYGSLIKDDERILSNDWVAVSLDTYSDGIIAYTFFVDINGNQFDGTLNSSKDLSNSFSLDFVSAVKYHDNGYVVEMQIPLYKLPLRYSNDLNIGLLFVHKSGDIEYQFPSIDEKTKNKIDCFTKMKLQGIKKHQSDNLSGVNIWHRLEYKKEQIKDLSTLEGRSKGGDASIADYYIFKKRIINASRTQNLSFKDSSSKTSIIGSAFMSTKFMTEFYPNTTDWETFLERSQTAAFLVLQNDQILYEKYFNGFNKDSTITSFSMAKSITSILIGIAIKLGLIKSELAKVTDYIPELLLKDERFRNISIKDLLLMSSGIKYNEEGFPGDDDFTYISPDLRSTTLERVLIENSPQRQWLYNNYNPILLGIILERATKKSVSNFLEEHLWSYIGEKNASWSLDEVGFEKMESGFNATPRDFLRIGLLMLKEGRWNRDTIISEEWIKHSTQPVFRPNGYYDFLKTNNLYYQYFWWGKNRAENKHDFFAMGNKGQYLYIIPSKNIVILRLGIEYGLFTPAPLSWPELFYQFGSEYND